MTSAGSYLLLTGEEHKVLERLREAGVNAVALGDARAQNARVIRNGEDTRYLDRPARDELARWQDEHMRINAEKNDILRRESGAGRARNE